MSNLRTHLPPPPQPNARNNPLVSAPHLNQSPQLNPTQAAIADVVNAEIQTGITILDQRIQDKFRQLEQELEVYKKQVEEVNRTLVVYEKKSEDVKLLVDDHDRRIEKTETIQTAQQKELQDIQTDFNSNIESLATTLTEKWRFPKRQMTVN